ncbi:MAG: extracellular solute-binding protein [Rhodovibrionaceae bacterium]
MRFPAALISLILLLAPQAASAQNEMPAVPLTPVEVAEDVDPPVYRSHAIAMHGTPKYGPDFAHFDYVNPDAPKGGQITQAVQGTFDSFNGLIPKGNPASTGSIESLLIGSADEPFTMYGLLAEEIIWPEDRSWVTFTLRPEARWHDGRPVTPEDVIFSLNLLKEEGRPFYRFYYGSIEKAEQTGERQVKFTFTEAGNRELPLIVGQMPILPKHYWEGRDFSEPTLESPLGSGPYRVKSFDPGRNVVLERVEDYWGRDLAVRRGTDNFDSMRFEYFRDDNAIRQALKAGVIDYREENQAKAWAVDYDIPAIREGWLVKETVEHERPAGMQAFIFNTRRDIFADPRVRQAIGLAFDFEWTNPALFFGQYERNESFFENSELGAREGPPQGQVLEVLEPYRGRVPDSVFGDVYDAPTTDGEGWPRENLLQALELLKAAGWEIRDQTLVDAETGRPFRFEILLFTPTFERIVLPMVRNLKRLGIDVRVRLVDQSTYINRLRSYDFDMISGGWGQSDSPGNEQREYWSTAAAGHEGSRNYAGIEDPVVDELIELVIQAPDRESLIARTRALDRVLLSGYYVIPAWHLSADRLIYWNKFSRPEVTPKNGTDLSYWWYDAEKAALLERREIREEIVEGAQEDSAGDEGVSNRTLGIAAALLLLAALGIWAALRKRPEGARMP